MQAVSIIPRPSTLRPDLPTDAATCDLNSRHMRRCAISQYCMLYMEHASAQGVQVVAEERAGTAEEIAAVFVAALRALGLLVRYVRHAPLRDFDIFDLHSASTLTGLH